MRKLALALIALLLLTAPAVAQSTKAQLNTEVSTNFPDNTTGLITPAILRTTVNDFISSWQQAASVNAQTGTTYTVLVGDYGKLVTFSNGSAIAVTLPQATGSFATFNVYVRNLGAGTVTITPATSTVNGAATLVLTTGQAAWIVSDGTNYQTWLNGAVVTTCAGLPALTGDVTNSAGSCATTIAANVVTYAKFQQVAASSLVGNPTGSLANAQGITLGATLAFSGSVLQTAAHTGDVTTAANSFATTLATAQSGAHTWSAVNTFSNATAATNSGTGAVVITTGGLGVGGAVWATNLVADSGVQTANIIISNVGQFTNTAAPASPAAGSLTLWGDSTNLRFHDKNAAGVIGTTVVADTGAANNYISAISAAGVITKSQPAFSNLSGSATCAQLPALTGDATTSAGACATTLATVNSNVGTFGSATQASQVTVNAKGLVTAAANVTVTPAVGSITGLGTGVATALAVNVGTAGAFVVNGGALGSPSSAGTLPAFTLGGTVSGGGNQINNVIIGTSTPLAGSFTTLTASTSVTSPLLIGGTAAGSTLTLESTSGTGTSDALIFLTGSQVERARIETGGKFNIGPNVAADALLTVMGNTAATVAPLATAYLHIVGADSANPRMVLDSFGGIPIFQARRADGTLASKSAVASGVQVFNFSPQTWGGSTYAAPSGIQFLTTELQSETARGGKIVFTVVANTTTNNLTAVTIDQDRSITVAGTTASTSKTTGSGIFGGGIGVAGATYTDTLNIITVANAATTAALCWNSGTGLVTENGAVGTCTVSLLAAKNLLRPLTNKEGFDIVMAMEPWRYTMKEGLPTWVAGEQIGFVADYADKIGIAKPVVAHNHDGSLGGFRYEQYTAALTGAFKYHDVRLVALEAANDNLRAEIDALKRRVAR